MIPAIAVYLGSSSVDAAAALSVGAAMRTGTGLWALGLGGSVGTGTAGSSGWVLGLPLLAVTALFLWCTRGALRRAPLAGPGSAAITVSVVAISTAIILGLAGPGGSGAWPALAGTTILTALMALIHLQRAGRGWDSLTAWWARRPGWVDPALLLARDSGIALAAGSLILVIVAFLQGADRVASLHDSLTAGAIIPSLGVIALELSWAPTMVVWALSWLAGPGFSVGDGTTFAPDHVVAGAVPAMPILGMIPTAPVGGPGSLLGLYLPLVITLAAMIVVVLHRRPLREMDLLPAVVAAVAATALLTVGTLVACLAASGAIGPGRLATAGPNIALTVLLVFIEAGVGLTLGTILIHPTTHALTERGVRTTAQAAGTAATTARAKVEAEREAARQRKLAAQEAAEESPDEVSGGNEASSGVDNDDAEEGTAWLGEVTEAPLADPEAEAAQWEAPLRIGVNAPEIPAPRVEEMDAEAALRALEETTSQVPQVEPSDRAELSGQQPAARRRTGLFGPDRGRHAAGSSGQADDGEVSTGRPVDAEATTEAIPEQEARQDNEENE